MAESWTFHHKKLHPRVNKNVSQNHKYHKHSSTYSNSARTSTSRHLPQSEPISRSSRHSSLNATIQRSGGNGVGGETRVEGVEGRQATGGAAGGFCRTLADVNYASLACNRVITGQTYSLLLSLPVCLPVPLSPSHTYIFCLAVFLSVYLSICLCTPPLSLSLHKQNTSL